MPLEPYAAYMEVDRVIAASGAARPVKQAPAQADDSADDAERAVQSIKYQPRGQRGLAGIRAAGFGRTGSLGDYVKKANAETLVVAQIETA